MNRTVSLTIAAAAGVWVTRIATRLRRRIDLHGRVVLITGGSRGLGLLLAREFGRRGARVAVCARDDDTLERARLDLERRGVDATTLACNVADRRQAEDMIRQVRERVGEIDVLVNNAGVIQVGPLETMTIDDVTEAMATNFGSGVYTTFAALDGLRRRCGRIVNISSIGGIVSVPHLVPYSASKFAVGGFSEGLRAELAKDGVLVTTVYPGLMRTGSPRHATFKGQHRAEYAWFSIGDSLPLVSMDADRAARRIVDACRDGEARVVLSTPAKAAALAHGLVPGLVIELLAGVPRLLPAPGGIGSGRRRGAESQSSASPSWLTRLGDRAAERNNQVA